MWIGLALLIVGLLYIPSKQRRNFRRIGGYEILLPRISRSGRFHFHLGTPSFSFSGPTQPPSSPNDSEADGDVPVLHTFDDRSNTSSPTSDSFGYSDPYAGRTQSPLIEAFQHVFNRVMSRPLAGFREIEPDTPIRTSRRIYNRGVLFFLPAIFTQSQDIELQLPAPRSRSISPPVLPRYSPHSPEKVRHGRDVSPAQDFGSSRHSVLESESDTPPLVILEDTPRSRSRTRSRPRVP
jgi:hypothetical protein